MTLQPLITREAAARLLGCTPQFVSVLAREGAIGHVRVGRRLCFEERHIAAYVARNRVGYDREPTPIGSHRLGADRLGAVPDNPRARRSNTNTAPARAGGAVWGGAVAEMRDTCMCPECKAPVQGYPNFNLCAECIVSCLYRVELRPKAEHPRPKHEAAGEVSLPSPAQHAARPGSGPKSGRTRAATTRAGGGRG